MAQRRFGKTVTSVLVAIWYPRFEAANVYFVFQDTLARMMIKAEEIGALSGRRRVISP